MAIILEAETFRKTFKEIALYYAEQDYLQGSNALSHLGKNIDLAKDFLRVNPEALPEYKGKKYKSSCRRITLNFKFQNTDFKPLKKFKNLYILYDYDKSSDILILIGLYPYRKNF